MLTLIISGLLSSWVPSGLDFSMFPADRAKARMDVWVTVTAANGEVLDWGRWHEYYGEHSRDELIESHVDKLERNGCKVEQRGDVVVVRTFKGSPVVKVEVKTTGPGPKVVLVPRAPPEKKK